jgi:hypothetical protein
MTKRNPDRQRVLALCALMGEQDTDGTLDLLEPMTRTDLEVLVAAQARFLF